MLTDFEILKETGMTDYDAKKHLERGTTVYRDFEEHLEDYIEEFDSDEEGKEAIREMVRTGKPMPDWDVVDHNGHKYYICYCL